MSVVLSVMFIKLYFAKIVGSDTFIMKINYYIKKALYFPKQSFELSIFQM